MKKLTPSLLAVLLAAALLAGCGGGASSNPASSGPAASAPAVSTPADSQPASSDPQAEYNLTDVVSAVEAANPIANPREIDDFSLENTYMLTMDNVADFCGRGSNDAANSVQAAPGKADEVKAELDAYKTALADGGLYAEFADKEAQAKEARLVVKGDCVVLVIANTEGAQYADIDKALDEALS